MGADLNVLEMNNISKTFPGVHALKNVNLAVKKGTVHALMGENGAGKSTLMKILIGMYTQYDGEIIFKGERLAHSNIKSAIDAGISMIHQELSYVPNMTVSENLFLGNEPKNRWGVVDRKKLREDTQSYLNLIGVKLDPGTLMKDLSVSERQMVEIAKAISYKSDVIIMDEPTSAISDREVERLFKIIEGLKMRGVAIIYISHKMDEIFRIADEFTVLRDGTFVGTQPIEGANIDQMIAMMVGRRLTDLFPRRTPEYGAAVLAVRNLTKRGVFENISFEVRKGEILGIAGLMGSGRTEVVNCIYGLDRSDSGEIRIRDSAATIRNPKDGMRQGIGLVSEDRKTLGLVLQLSVKENIMLPNFRLCTRYQIVSDAKEKTIADGIIKDLAIKTPTRDQKAGNLSGGNQQKIVIGKVLLGNPELLILDEPTRGIDIGAKSEIYKLISQLAEQGKAIIVVSSELPEIMGLSDRIVVLHEGKITGELTREEASEEKIMAHAFGK
ncbi:sugar ABC transporter ATP-binding protein [Cohnella herbarum]|uniref:Sugar ABC transporter ATP-binding protein n=1 Tax=Cohnella herbarum TaxID=2728023 RepID=A0A7Z2VQP2_9BACL|nr:sugar ABC transporter ATP-binding protein [Cohnella herbarum]QJD87693.1 sugar ABC transporter ATP-binding protein [Cohnella herbarum]